VTKGAFYRRGRAAKPFPVVGKLGSREGFERWREGGALGGLKAGVIGQKKEPADAQKHLEKKDHNV